MADQRWGSAVDREAWNSLFLAGGEFFTHDLWCAVIRTIAAAVVAKTRRERPSSEQVDDCEPDELITDWQNRSMPTAATLVFVVGEYDYFYDIDMSWDEKLSLSGEACGYPLDVVRDLTDRLDGDPDAQDAVTEESVEQFFSEWRTRFLQRVLREATALKPKQVR
jgi:hypothetical protein